MTPSTWVPDGQGDEPTPIGHVLDGLTRKLGSGRPEALGIVFRRWREIVGDGVADHAWPMSLRDKKLLVGVDEPGWATQVRYLSTDLLGRLAEAVGEGVVEAVDVRVRPRRDAP